MMKWPWLLIGLVFSFSVFAAKLEFFYGPDCPRCEHARAALVDYQGSHPDLEVVGVDVYKNPENLARLRYLGIKEKLITMKLPAFYYHSTMKAGLDNPQSLLVWIEETQKNAVDIGVFSFFGKMISYQKSGALTFSVLLAIKDFVLSIWGLLLIALSLGLIFLQRKFDSVIGMFCFLTGATLSAILWSLPSTRVWFEQVVMVDFILALIGVVVSIVMILKTKKFSLSGWSELGIFSLGIVLQRLISIFSGFELLRLQDALLEAGSALGEQLAMNIVYGLVQLVFATIIIFVASKMKKK